MNYSSILSSSSDESEIEWVGQDATEDDEKYEYNVPETPAAPKVCETETPSTSKQTLFQEPETKEHGSAKKRKWDVKFKKYWREKYEWILEGNSISDAQCRLCRCQFSIKHGGENDVVKHMKTDKHVRNVNALRTKSVSCYFQTSSDKDTVSLAECAFVFHAIKHSQSYISADCAGKLFPLIFEDSKVAGKYSCGKTKATKIATKILGPESRNIIKNDLENNQPFSVATDASNKGNVKTFPLVVKYFQIEKGVNTKLLKFYASASEKSVDIAKCLIDGLSEAGLSIQNVTAYCADNASVNFGKKQSVITELQKYNENILPFGCVCHIIHNAGKYGQNVLRYDIETIVIKCYNEFSSSSKKVSELKEFYNFCEEEWSELLRSVPTRWLSLIPAVERLLKHFVPIRSYFLSKASAPPILKQFFEDELAEAYLGVVLNIGTAMNDAISKLESKSALAVELFGIMETLRRSLIIKREQSFYGSVALALIRRCDDTDRVAIFKKGANSLIERIIEYLEKWYDFTDSNKFKYLSAMDLRCNPKLDDFLKIADEFKIAVNVDLFFEEFVNLKIFLENAPKNFADFKIDQQWVNYFKAYKSPNYLQICSHVFSLPHSNAMSERVFSLMSVAWRKERIVFPWKLWSQN